MTVETMEIRRPDDMHLHLRNGSILPTLVAATEQHFARAIVMPNIDPPVTTVELALKYRERILAARFGAFEPLMTLYMTDETTPYDVERAAACPFVHGIKVYPRGTTTNSGHGVTDITTKMDVLWAMERCDLPLLLHGEVNDPDVDVFDREFRFLQILKRITDVLTMLKIVLEHVTTAVAVNTVLHHPTDHLSATITAHHLLANRNDMLGDGIKPHLYCKPILKREQDRLALLRAATSGSPRFFAGTDSAPHIRDWKECSRGCAGCYTAPVAMSLYAEAFEQAGRLDRLEDFTSKFGAEFYGLPLNEGTITLERTGRMVPGEFHINNSSIVPFWAGRRLSWV